MNTDKYPHNPHYNPEKLNLEHYCVDRDDMCYEFDKYCCMEDMKNKPTIEDSYNLVYYKKQLEKIDDKIKSYKIEREHVVEKIKSIEAKFN